MGSISADNTYVVPKARTVRLRAALAAGVAAVAAAFGAGWVLADASEVSVATASEPRTAASHTVDRALTDSLALKGRAAQSEISDIRKRRVE